MTNLEFFKSLDYEDGLGVVTGTLERFPLQYAATLTAGTLPSCPVAARLSSVSVAALKLAKHP